MYKKPEKVMVFLPQKRSPKAKEKSFLDSSIKIKSKNPMKSQQINKRSFKYRNSIKKTVNFNLLQINGKVSQILKIENNEPNTKKVL